jgi:hypothetical protein
MVPHWLFLFASLRVTANGVHGIPGSLGHTQHADILQLPAHLRKYQALHSRERRVRQALMEP